MKRTTKILLYLLVAAGVIFFAGAFFLTVVGHTLDKESKAFVDSAIPAIVSDWDVMEIRKRASPEFNKTVDYEDMQQMFDVLRGLGGLLEYAGSTGESRIIISVEDGIVITAVYEGSADFESGSADIQLSLVKHDGQWQILGFKIAPEDTELRKDII
jgi:hypothetical protein